MAKVVHKSFPVFKSVDVSNVDRENGIIKNVVIIESGIDKYGDNFDETFLRSMELQGNSQPMGVKSRFGHPSMSKEALGSYLGRFKNFNVGDVEGKQVLLADLYLDKTAKASPTNGNMYDYVLDMASSNDDMFGNSVVFMADKEEIKTEKDVDGNEVRVPYIRLKTFMASDIVDSPAATTSLFKDYNEGNFAAKATEFFDENPEFVTLLKSHPEKVKEFINKYEIFKEMAEEKSFLVKLKALISGAEKKKESVATLAGASVNIEGPVAVGSMVTDDAGTPVSDQKIDLADGNTITTDADGKITEVTATGSSSDDMAKELNDLKAINKSTSDELVKVKSDYDLLMKENAEIKSTSALLIKEVETKEKDITNMKEILSTITTDLNIPASNTTFAGSQTSAKKSDAVDSDELKKRAAERLESERKKNLGVPA